MNTDRIAQVVRAADVDLESPGRRDYLVALPHDSIWGDHLVPLTVFVGPGAEAGRGLVAFGATHGDEYEGPIALAHLRREISLSDVLGRIVLVPVLNRPAFAAGARSSVLDDRVNLNRAFVAGAGEAPSLAGITHRIADFVRNRIFPLVDVVIDLHAGGEVAEFAPCTSYHPIADPDLGRRIEETARWFGTPLLVTYENATPGLLTSQAERLGKVTVGSELGWGRSARRYGVAAARHGVLAAAIHHGYLRGTIEPIGHHAAGTQRIVSTVDPECVIPAPFAGHYESLVACGDDVRQGTVVGLLHDFDRLDLEPVPLEAAIDGVLVAQAWAAPVVQGQHVVVVGRLIGPGAP
jgi:N-alpha-acetyl-L-2,4-diaminobutyrate deacetylase